MKKKDENDCGDGTLINIDQLIKRTSNLENDIGAIATALGIKTVPATAPGVPATAPVIPATAPVIPAPGVPAPVITAPAVPAPVIPAKVINAPAVLPTALPVAPVNGKPVVRLRKKILNSH